MTRSATIRDQDGGAGDACRAILATIPSWFGVEAANDEYIALAENGPSVIVAVDGDDVGMTIIKRHFAETAEVYFMAVRADHRRQGLGGQMLRHVETGLASEGVRFLQVKTLSSGRVDAGYDETRAFYRAYGFVPLEEFPDLWDPSNPALQLIKGVAPA